MTRRDFIRLPMGDHILATKYYKYKLNKCTIGYPDGRKKIAYFIQQVGQLSDGSLWLYEELFDIDEVRSRYKRTMLTASTFLMGLSIHTEDTWYLLNDFRLLPRSSYKEWLLKVESVTA